MARTFVYVIVALLIFLFLYTIYRLIKFNLPKPKVPPLPAEKSELEQLRASLIAKHSMLKDKKEIAKLREAIAAIDRELAKFQNERSTEAEANKEAKGSKKNKKSN